MFQIPRIKTSYLGAMIKSSRGSKHYAGEQITKRNANTLIKTLRFFFPVSDGQHNTIIQILKGQFYSIILSVLCHQTKKKKHQAHSVPSSSQHTICVSRLPYTAPFQTPSKPRPLSTSSSTNRRRTPPRTSASGLG